MGEYIRADIPAESGTGVQIALRRRNSSLKNENVDRIRLVLGDLSKEIEPTEYR
jgi:hypothetical protein